MITVSEAVQKKIKEVPFLEEGLAQGVINLSALARRIRPEIEKALWKEVSEAAILMALKRYQPEITQRNDNIEQLEQLKNLTVCSNLVEYAFRNSPDLIKLHAYLGEEVQGEKELFMNYAQGVLETTLIVSEKLQEKIEKRVAKELILDKVTNLSSIALRLSAEHIYVPGVNYALLKALAWENINIIEVISAYSEITIVVKSDDVDRAFSCIKQLTTKSLGI